MFGGGGGEMSFLFTKHSVTGDTGKIKKLHVLFVQ